MLYSYSERTGRVYLRPEEKDNQYRLVLTKGGNDIFVSKIFIEDNKVYAKDEDKNENVFLMKTSQMLVEVRMPLHFFSIHNYFASFIASNLLLQKTPNEFSKFYYGFSQTPTDDLHKSIPNKQRKS